MIAAQVNPLNVVGATRSRRVLWALAATWLLGAFDLHYTLGEARNPMFSEDNPVAAPLLSCATKATTYKIATIGGATLILLALRKHPLAEFGAWTGMAVHVWVGMRWSQYFTEVGQLQEGDWRLWAYATVGQPFGV